MIPNCLIAPNKLTKHYSTTAWNFPSGVASIEWWGEGEAHRHIWVKILDKENTLNFPYTRIPSDHITPPLPNPKKRKPRQFWGKLQDRFNPIRGRPSFTSMYGVGGRGGGERFLQAVTWNSTLPPPLQIPQLDTSTHLLISVHWIRVDCTGWYYWRA